MQLKVCASVPGKISNKIFVKDISIIKISDLKIIEKSIITQ
jgi:hypothetical protein